MRSVPTTVNERLSLTLFWHLKLTRFLWS
jgi:hypothetical protein